MSKYDHKRIVELARYILAQTTKWGRCYVSDTNIVNLETVPSAEVPVGGVVIAELEDEYYVLRKRKKGALFVEYDMYDMYVQIDSTKYWLSGWNGLGFPLGVSCSVFFTGVILKEYAKEQEDE